jgi:PAS domain S-box-containing protein
MATAQMTSKSSYEEVHARLQALQETFEAFLVRSQKLEQASQSLQKTVGNLNLQLDKKNAELAASLAKQEEMQTYLGSILESMNNGVIGIDIMGTITSFNRAASEITGYGRDDVVGNPYANFFQRENGSPYSLLHTLSSGKELRRDEKVLWHKDGHPVPVSFQTAMLRDRDNRMLGAVEIFSDISRIKALEEEMQRTKTMAALGEMAATVAHEIRNPLGAMGGWAGLLERDLEPDDPRRKILGRITEGLARLNRIVSNLLVYTRPVKATMRKISLAALLEEIIDFVGIEIERQQQNIAVQKKWKSGNELFILADPEKLHQVIMNLCLNAMQAMPEGGALSVNIDGLSRERSEYVCFTISDTGIGIDKDSIGKIFDPFYTTKENGTGLGLAIVKKIVEFHSGYITIDSTVKKGTTARVFLPRLKE